MPSRSAIKNTTNNGQAKHENEARASVRNTLNDLTAREWLPETKSVWFQKGLGADHVEAQIERLHPAPFSYQDVMRLIGFFTKAKQRILDPFAGVGSTLKACAVTGRVGTGIELENSWVDLTKKRLAEEVGGSGAKAQKIIKGDCREVLPTLKDNTYKLVVTSPPYWQILSKPPDHKVKNGRVNNGLSVEYGHHKKDLAKIESYESFLAVLGEVFLECLRVLEPRGHLCVIVSDFRHGRRLVPYHANLNDAINRLQWRGQIFDLQGITILAQNQKRLFPYGYPTTFVPNIHHQYILIYRKASEDA